jgi:hypothetical protein
MGGHLGQWNYFKLNPGTLLSGSRRGYGGEWVRVALKRLQEHVDAHTQGTGDLLDVGDPGLALASENTG